MLTDGLARNLFLVVEANAGRARKCTTSHYWAHLALMTDEVLLAPGSNKLHNARAITHDLQTNGQFAFVRLPTKEDGMSWYHRGLVGIFERRSASTAQVFGPAVLQMKSPSEIEWPPFLWTVAFIDQLCVCMGAARLVARFRSHRPQETPT